MTVQIGPLEARIIDILKMWYPITVEELRDELSLRRDVLERTLKSLIAKGIIVLEPLSDKTYIRLVNSEIDVSVKGRKKVGPKRHYEPEKQAEDDSIMYR